VSQRRVTRSTVERLPLYLRAVATIEASGQTVVSSDQLAIATGLSGDTVRRDIWSLHLTGVRGVGYEVEALRTHMEKALGATSGVRTAIVGVGNMGSALLNYKNLAQAGFRVVAAFDLDRQKIGHALAGITVQPAALVTEVCQRLGVEVGVVATPSNAAQETLDKFAAAGVRAVLNFAPVALRAPSGVVVRQMDVAKELQVLAYYVRLEDRLSAHLA